MRSLVLSVHISCNFVRFASRIVTLPLGCVIGSVRTLCYRALLEWRADVEPAAEVCSRKDMLILCFAWFVLVSSFTIDSLRVTVFAGVECVSRIDSLPVSGLIGNGVAVPNGDVLCYPRNMSAVVHSQRFYISDTVFGRPDFVLSMAAFYLNPASASGAGEYYVYGFGYGRHSADPTYLDMDTNMRSDLNLPLYQYYCGYSYRADLVSTQVRCHRVIYGSVFPILSVDCIVVLCVAVTYTKDPHNTCS